LSQLPVVSELVQQLLVQAENLAQQKKPSAVVEHFLAMSQVLRPFESKPLPVESDVDKDALWNLSRRQVGCVCDVCTHACMYARARAYDGTAATAATQMVDLASS